MGRASQPINPQFLGQGKGSSKVKARKLLERGINFLPEMEKRGGGSESKRVRGIRK